VRAEFLQQVYTKAILVRFLYTPWNLHLSVDQTIRHKSTLVQKKHHFFLTYV